MEKCNGSEGCSDGIIKVGRGKWELIYGTDNPEFYWRHRFDHAPSIDEIKAVIKESLNRETERKIIEDFSWRGVPVWLSSENQFNYKAAYDLALQTDGASLPVKFKLGTDAEPVYQVFDNIADLAEFYTAALIHISSTIEDGWMEKDKVDAMSFDIEA
ncbi:MAG: hypothetical protein ACI4AK_09345 [Lepagella sp.]